MFIFIYFCAYFVIVLKTKSLFALNCMDTPLVTTPSVTTHLVCNVIEISRSQKSTTEYTFDHRTLVEWLKWEMVPDMQVKHMFGWGTCVPYDSQSDLYSGINIETHGTVGGDGSVDCCFSSEVLPLPVLKEWVRNRKYVEGLYNANEVKDDSDEGDKDKIYRDEDHKYKEEGDEDPYIDYTGRAIKHCSCSKIRDIYSISGITIRNSMLKTIDRTFDSAPLQAALRAMFPTFISRGYVKKVVPVGSKSMYICARYYAPFTTTGGSFSCTMKSDSMSIE